MFRERERRSRCINLVVANGHCRSFWADNSNYRDLCTLLHSRQGLAAYLYGQPWLLMLQIYVLIVESSIYLQKNLASYGERDEV